MGLITLDIAGTGIREFGISNSGLTLLDLHGARHSDPQSSEGANSALPVARAIEAASPLIFYGSPADFEGGFRRISQPTSPWRDLLPPMQWNMQRVSYYLYVTNPLARRIVEMMKDFVVGEGVMIQANDSRVQDVLDDFWNDPVNRMDQNLEAFVRECSIFGEQLWYTASNPISGKVRLGYIDPYWIDGVEYATLQGLPGKAMAMASAIILKTGPAEPEQTRLQVVHPDEDPSSPTFGQLVGNCFYWAINKARSGHRGLSDLFALADWLDGYDQMLYSLMNQMDSLSRFIWDVTLQGQTGEQIKEWLKDNGTPPRPNSIRAHNEKVTWAAVSPQVQAADRSEGARLIKNMSLAGAGFPEHWFATGEHTNRATALVQGEPTLKMLTARQKQLKFMVEQILDYVIDRQVAAGALPDDVDRTFAAHFPELSVGDQEKSGAALKSAADALVEFQKAGAVDTRTMALVLVQMLSQLGIDADPDEILDRAQQEAADSKRANLVGAPASQSEPRPKGSGPKNGAEPRIETEGPPGSIGIPGAGGDGGKEYGLNTGGPANML